MDKDTSEIAKLTERIAKDPKSKLFVPLAEEYKKTGDLEMSIHVLREGLKNNPAYVTARSFLGRLLIETGDLPGARKEFEEVVKAIPDNLMAQRKLGDLSVLQDNPTEALSRYKIVLSLNPRDSETALLITEAEAGRDLKKHLSASKITAREEQKKTEPLQAASAQVENRKPEVAAPKAIPETVDMSMTAPAVEEPEEVLFVEPLDSDLNPDQELPVIALNFPEESDLGPAVSEKEEDTEDALFALNQPFASERSPVFDAPILELGEALEPGEQDKQADDFTTDTLAELYISQGFFEKAVDIYERMLIDNPKSQKLRDKLANVRAMAAKSVSDTDVEPESDAFTIPDDFVVQTASPESTPEEQTAPDPFASPIPEAAQPRLDDWELPASNVSVIDDDTPSRAAKPIRPSQHFEVGFEPREYVPPGAVPRISAASMDMPGFDSAADEMPIAQGAEPPVSAVRKPASAGRKETVDRLESWLKNIKKEK